MRCAYCLGLLTLLLAGCKVGPDYRRPDTPAAGAYKENQGWQPAAPAQISADEPWWSIYDDPLLDSLERQVHCFRTFRLPVTIPAAVVAAA